MPGCFSRKSINVTGKNRCFRKQSKSTLHFFSHLNFSWEREAWILPLTGTPDIPKATETVCGETLRRQKV